MTIRGSLEGLSCDGVQTQQRDLVEETRRQPAQKGCTWKPMGSRKGLTQSPSSIVCENTTKAARRISHFMDFIDRFYNTLIMLVSLLCILFVVHAQINHSPIPLTVQNVHLAPKRMRVPAGSVFTDSFNYLGYDYGGAVYETHDDLQEDQINNRSFYWKSISCEYFNSKLKMNIVQTHTLKNGGNVQALIFLGQTFEIYTIQSNNSYSESNANATRRFLAGNKVDRKGISQETKSANLHELKLNSSEDLDIMLLTINKIILITDGVKIVGIQANNFFKHWQLNLDLKQSSTYTYAFAAENELLDFKVQSYDPATSDAVIHFFWDTAIRTFQISKNCTAAQLKIQLLPPKGTKFLDATASDGSYWTLVQEYFVAYRPNLQGVFESSAVKLESKQCFKIYKHEDTIHMICTEDGINYIAQYFLNKSFTKPEEALYLNRYYTQVDDAKNLLLFGGEFSEKFLISGDDDFQIVPYAVNRQALIEALGLQKAERFRAFDIKQVYLLPIYSNLTQTYVIGVDQGTLVLFQLIQEPPEIECQIPVSIFYKSWRILVEVNSSSCIANNERTQLESICSYTIPYTLEASWIEVEASNHQTVIVTTILILLAILIALVGCAIKCKNKVKQAGSSLRKKLISLKKDKEMKPI